jgi:hypothetical protein
MSTDAQLLQRAANLLADASSLMADYVEDNPETGRPRVAVAEWQHAHRRWLSDYERQNETTRWRPIDLEGNIATEPAPATPDDPDEGETGPPEVAG